MTQIQRALVSVSDKTGILAFCKKLHNLGIELISTGGTAKLLQKEQLPVIEISDFTGFPEIMDGRVKTLHPKVHGGILANRDLPDHLEVAEKYQIPLIDLVIVNLYPFQQVIQNPEISLADAIENIDIGGPTMLRAAAKNHQHVTVIVDPNDYEMVYAQLAFAKNTDLKTREKLAIKVFQHTNQYDAAIDKFFSDKLLQEKRIHLTYTKGEELRYGENSHQQAIFYCDPQSTETSIANAKILNGKAMSYNNYVDADAALSAIKEFSVKQPAVSVIKHTNPCGLATGDTVAEALGRAWEGDPISAFGGVIATNQTVDLAFAEFLKGSNQKHYSYVVKDGEYLPQESVNGKFVEIIIAPDYTADALNFLQKKSRALRLLQIEPSLTNDPLTFRHITGGLLAQDPDGKLISKFEVVTKKDFPASYRQLTEFTWIATKHTKSNAVILGREYAPGKFQVIGMGAGQPNRVDSMRKLALPKAKENMRREYDRENITLDFELWFQQELAKFILVSDAFFPFDDTVREAAACGIKYIVQPGGSMRDQDVIQACDELGIAMVFTGLRHFNH